MTDRITDEMVEAAARAICASSLLDPDLLLLDDSDETKPDRPWVPQWSVFARYSRAALSAALPLMDGGALPPVERDEQFDRTYYPLPGGWEVQTKGTGSTFRLCNTKTVERVAIMGTPAQRMMERMAIEIRAALPPAPNGDE